VRKKQKKTKLSLGKTKNPPGKKQKPVEKTTGR
jgi:hypothetical protein